MIPGTRTGTAPGKRGFRSRQPVEPAKDGKEVIRAPSEFHRSLGCEGGGDEMTDRALYAA
jgi:hypothetical protein